MHFLCTGSCSRSVRPPMRRRLTCALKISPCSGSSNDTFVWATKLGRSATTTRLPHSTSRANCATTNTDSSSSTRGLQCVRHDEWGVWSGPPLGPLGAVALRPYLGDHSKQPHHEEPQNE